MTTVRIKSKGQFHGKIGELVKILNQHQVVVKFKGIKGVFNFRHSSVELISIPISEAFNDQVAKMLSDACTNDINNALISICDEISVEIGKLHGHTSNESVAALTAYTKAMQIVQSKFVKS